MADLSSELIAKLLKAQNREEMATLLKAAGVDSELAEQIMAELIRKREADGRELSPDELDAVSGGKDRNWLTDGCAATVEAGSWCDTDDACGYWDVTYDNYPLKHHCLQCGGQTYCTYKGSYGTKYKCMVCGYEGEF